MATRKSFFIYGAGPVLVAGWFRSCRHAAAAAVKKRNARIT
ncbi:hypothetical protein DVDV_0330 [Desulfovibrio sp. DV]|nr:hypothetical protein [Desulfovibrio sp. DV]OLN30886.1 hypothetical protein DVDV_0330 [Desulfovibrio sp. DV]